MKSNSLNIKKNLSIYCLIFFSFFIFQAIAQEQLETQKPSTELETELDTQLENEAEEIIPLDENKRYISYSINEDVVEEYDRFNHSSTWRYTRKYFENEQKLYKQNKLRDYSWSNYGKYILARRRNSASSANKNCASDVMVYDLSDLSVVFKLKNVKDLNIKYNQDFYFFFAHKCDNENWVLNKNGKVLAKTSIIKRISNSYLDGYTHLHTSSYNDTVKFKFNSLKELADVINTIEEKQLKTSIDIYNYFAEKTSNKKVLYSFKRYFNYDVKKYYYILPDIGKTKEYDDIREFYNHYLVKENGLYGIMSKSAEEIVEPAYDVILIHDENNIELCDQGQCIAYQLEILDPSYSVSETEETSIDESQNNAVYKTEKQDRDIKKNEQLKQFNFSTILNSCKMENFEEFSNFKTYLSIILVTVFSFIFFWFLFKIDKKDKDI